MIRERSPSGKKREGGGAQNSVVEATESSFIYNSQSKTDHQPTPQPERSLGGENPGQPKRACGVLPDLLTEDTGSEELPLTRVKAVL